MRLKDRPLDVFNFKYGYITKKHMNLIILCASNIIYYGFISSWSRRTSDNCELISRNFFWKNSTLFKKHYKNKLFKSHQVQTSCGFTRINTIQIIDNNFYQICRNTKSSNVKWIIKSTNILGRIKNYNSAVALQWLHKKFITLSTCI